MENIYNIIRNNKKLLIKAVIIILCSVIIGLAFSVTLAAIDYFRAGDYSGINKLESSNICLEDAGIENGNYTVSEDGGKIIISLDQEQYINKLQFQYSVEESLEKDAKIVVYAKNIYGNIEKRKITDSFFSYGTRSVVNIKAVTEKIEITFPKNNGNIVIGDFQIHNEFVWNPFIAIVASGVVFLILYLWVFRKQNANHPGIATTVSLLVLGGCLLVLQPPFCSGWDEQIHVAKSYDVAVTREEQGVPNVSTYLIANAPWLNTHTDISFEERIDLIKVMNALGETYGAPTISESNDMATIGYLFTGAGITIGKFLDLPFYLVWILGKLSNLLLYAIGMGIAVCITPMGKRLLMVIAQFPIMIFLSTVYTYDVTVNVFIILGICILIRLIVDQEKIVTYKRFLAFAICLVVGCMPKAIYAPLILCGLFIPSSKFRSKKEAVIMKVIMIIVFLVLMSTFVLPTVTNPASTGDTRGGNTSVETQISYVLGQPFAYAVVLCKNIMKTFVDYTVGSMLSNCAYWGMAVQPILYSLLAIGTILTDSYEDRGKRTFLFVREKIVSLASIAITIALIWTALYLSFTEVGETTIAGVQGRYYLPFLFLMYLCFKPRKIECKFKLENYQMVLMFISSGLFVIQLVQNFLIPGCI